MKRCPECRRDYYDDTLLYCLDDGNALLEGPATASASDEPATAILHSTAAPGEAPTRAQIHMTDQTAILPTGTGDIVPKSRGIDKRLLAILVLLAIIVLGGFFGYRYLKPAGTEQINSIAVLPFENRSGNADTDYLSDGLADSLIYRLSQLPNLKVSPTSSVMRYKGKETDVAQIAKELEVDAVMSGRLVQRGDDLSISVQLIDARTKKLIWAEQYDRKMSDLLATQREIATTITQKLQLKLAGAETKGITKKYTDSNDAYQLYLKGRYHYAKRTKDDLEKGVEYFQQAVKLDPNFALAYAMIADSYASMPAYPYLSPKEAFPQAKAAASRALEIDPTLTEAHTAMAYSLALYDWNWAEAEREFKRAIELDPKSSLAHVRFAICYYLPTGRMNEAVKENELAVELEPLNLVGGANLTWMYLGARRNIDALAQGRKVNDLDAAFVLGRYQLGLAYNANGMYEEAISLTEKPLQADPADQLMLQVAGYAYARSGRKNEANAVISRFKEIAKTQYVMSFFVATIYAGLGEKNAAFAELEDAYGQRDWRMSALLKVEPMLDPLRDDPRYKDLLKRLNLPE
jgi:TolB-like protein/Tfp pilus assembly protein PilF